MGEPTQTKRRYFSAPAGMYILSSIYSTNVVSKDQLRRLPPTGLPNTLRAAHCPSSFARRSAFKHKFCPLQAGPYPPRNSRMSIQLCKYVACHLPRSVLTETRLPLMARHMEARAFAPPLSTSHSNASPMQKVVSLLPTTSPRHANPWYGPAKALDISILRGYTWGAHRHPTDSPRRSGAPQHTLTSSLPMITSGHLASASRFPSRLPPLLLLDSTSIVQRAPRICCTFITPTRFFPCHSDCPLVLC